MPTFPNLQKNFVPRIKLESFKTVVPHNTVKYLFEKISQNLHDNFDTITLVKVMQNLITYPRLLI